MAGRAGQFWQYGGDAAAPLHVARAVVQHQQQQGGQRHLGCAKLLVFEPRMGVVAVSLKCLSNACVLFQRAVIAVVPVLRQPVCTQCAVQCISFNCVDVVVVVVVIGSTAVELLRGLCTFRCCT